VVSPKSELNLWTTLREALSETSRAQVRINSISYLAIEGYTDKNCAIVKVDDILCLLESEREARRLR